MPDELKATKFHVRATACTHKTTGQPAVLVRMFDSDGDGMEFLVTSQEAIDGIAATFTNAADDMRKIAADLAAKKPT